MRIPKTQKSLRPTTGKVREALFDIIRGKVEDARFLDLYAGTGAVGLNALKEGATEVVFVEESKGSAIKISNLLKKTGVSEKTRVIVKKVLMYIKQTAGEDESFDIIFLDPPYHSDEVVDAMDAIGRSNIIRQGGIVIAEHFAKRSMPEKFTRLNKVKDYNYGDTVLSVYAAD